MSSSASFLAHPAVVSSLRPRLESALTSAVAEALQSPTDADPLIRIASSLLLASSSGGDDRMAVLARENARLQQEVVRLQADRDRVSGSGWQKQQADAEQLLTSQSDEETRQYIVSEYHAARKWDVSSRWAHLRTAAKLVGIKAHMTPRPADGEAAEATAVDGETSKASSLFRRQSNP